MKHTPLSATHIKLGAKMVDFAGYLMPVSYKSITEEHMQVREHTGVFDVSHMGEFLISGEGAFELVQKVTSNDASVLSVGDAQYSCMPNMDGGIVDDLLVYKLAEDSYMLVVNASNIEKDWNWIKENNVFDAEMHDASDEMALLAVQGPGAIAALQPHCSVDLNEIKFYTFTTGKFAGIDNVIISATGYTGSGGFELYIPAGNAELAWNAIFSKAEELNIEPVGLGARDTLRMEMGYCLYGNDIDDTTNPLEAGLGWITKTTKQFNGWQHIKKMREEKSTTRRLCGFELKGRGIPRQGYDILNDAGEKIGHVTSGTQSPCLGKGIGMGYINKPFSKTGNPIKIAIRNKQIDAEIVKLPFYKG